MTKPRKGESASEAMARHKAVMAQREKALDLMARQAAARKAESDKATSQKPATGHPGARCTGGEQCADCPWRPTVSRQAPLTHLVVNPAARSGGYVAVVSTGLGRGARQALLPGPVGLARGARHACSSLAQGDINGTFGLLRHEIVSQDDETALTRVTGNFTGPWPCIPSAPSDPEHPVHDLPPVLHRTPAGSGKTAAEVGAKDSRSRVPAGTAGHRRKMTSSYAATVQLANRPDGPPWLLWVFLAVWALCAVVVLFKLRRNSWKFRRRR